MEGWAVFAVAFAYLLLLFAVASWGDRQGRQGPRPAIYALSLAVYCTTWTFFGSVGVADASGWNWLGIYVGPTLMLVVGYPLVRRIVTLSKQERITSVADFVGARYGKSAAVAAVATGIAILGAVPYIALQLKAIASSVTTLLSHYEMGLPGAAASPGETAVLTTAALAAFAILFGTRHADATEHQDGMILAIALESVVKLAAFLAVGLYVTYVMFDGFADIWRQAAAMPSLLTGEGFGAARPGAAFRVGLDVGEFLVLTALSAMVFVLLPREFHVAVVENRSPSELARARWLFPLYLLAINLFVLPIAMAGRVGLGPGGSADSFVLLLPMSQGSDLFSMLAFIGGLSAGTAMVIVACVALAIMISNHLALPLLLRMQGVPHPAAGAEHWLLNLRRSAIVVLLLMAYAYYRLADNTQALAQIGLVSFVAIAQLAPAFYGGLLWRGANARGAIGGMIAGVLVWFYTLLLPTLLGPAHPLVAEGPWAVAWLRPQALLGLPLSPIANGMLWSLTLNTLAGIALSLTRRPSGTEASQAATFVGDPRRPPFGAAPGAPRVSIAELSATLGRYLGPGRAERALERFWAERGSRPPPEAPAGTALLSHGEQLLASAIGASSSRLVLTLLLQRHEVSSGAAIALLDEASEALRYNRDVLQSALEQLDEGVTVFDGRGHLAFWNRRFRKLAGLPSAFGQAGVTLEAIADGIAHYQRLADQGIAGRAIAERLERTGEPWLLALDAAERILELRSAPMPGGGLVVSWRDITERTLVAEALREANETLEKRVEERTSDLVTANRQLQDATRAADAANASKTRFLAAAGHDILQPLNAARLYASTLAERVEGGRERELAQNIGRSLESVEEILGAVLAISRLDTGRHDVKLADMPVARLFEQMELAFAPAAQAQGLRLRFAPSTLWVRTDPAMLRRMVQNLVSNALKYTPRGGVVVGCRRRGGQVSIEVVDTGIGIAVEEQEEVYTEFRRLPGGVRQAGGLGLGLSIVQRMAQLLGHGLELRSAPGQGTRFAVIVPRAEAQAAGPARAVERGAPASLDGLCVLAIDNDISILAGMTALLEQWGCRVVTASDRAGALAALAALPHPPDRVLADFHLEDDTGLEVIEALRRASERDLPAALVTADRSVALRARALATGVAVLNKPVRPAALRAVLAAGARPSSEAAE